jgi:hypothetical protein
MHIALWKQTHFSDYDTKTLGRWISKGFPILFILKSMSPRIQFGYYPVSIAVWTRIKGHAIKAEAWFSIALIQCISFCFFIITSYLLPLRSSSSIETRPKTWWLVWDMRIALHWKDLAVGNQNETSARVMQLHITPWNSLIRLSSILSGQ